VTAADLLRPEPFRGPQVAAGVAVLTTLVWLLQARFDEPWSSHSHLLYAAPSFAAVTAMAWLAPMESATPRPYQSVLFVASFALGVYALGDVADALGATAPVGHAGTTTWVFAVLALLMLAFAVRRNSAVSTLVAALSALVSAVAFVTWTAAPADAGPWRWVLLGGMAVFALAAVWQRDRRPRHAVALVDAAGVAALSIGLLDGVTILFGAESAGLASGWELVLVAAGFGLCAYSAVEREPGPGYLGVGSLVAFTLSAGSQDDAPSLFGWPLALALGAGVLLVIGLRPTTPAPPPPDVDAEPAETTPLHG
jgi:uncharacterized membrane protein